MNCHVRVDKRWYIYKSDNNSLCMYIIQCNNQTAFIASASLQDRSYGLIDFEFTSIKNKNMYEYLFTNKNGYVLQITFLKRI